MHIAFDTNQLSLLPFISIFQFRMDRLQVQLISIIRNDHRNDLSLCFGQCWLESETYVMQIMSFMSFVFISENHLACGIYCLFSLLKDGERLAN